MAILHSLIKRDEKKILETMYRWEVVNPYQWRPPYSEYQINITRTVNVGRVRDWLLPPSLKSFLHSDTDTQIHSKLQKSKQVQKELNLK